MKFNFFGKPTDKKQYEHQWHDPFVRTHENELKAQLLIDKGFDPDEVWQLNDADLDHNYQLHHNAEIPSIIKNEKARAASLPPLGPPPGSEPNVPVQTINHSKPSEHWADSIKEDYNEIDDGAISSSLSANSLEEIESQLGNIGLQSSTVHVDATPSSYATYDGSESMATSGTSGGTSGGTMAGETSGGTMAEEMTTKATKATQAPKIPTRRFGKYTVPIAAGVGLIGLGTGAAVVGYRKSSPDTKEFVNESPVGGVLGLNTIDNQLDIEEQKALEQAERDWQRMRPYMLTPTEQIQLSQANAAWKARQQFAYDSAGLAKQTQARMLSNRIANQIEAMNASTNAVSNILNQKVY